MIDLFGESVKDDTTRHRRLLFRRLPHYRPAESKERRCATCAHCQLHEIYHRSRPKRWRKCDLVGGGSPATDVKARWVCDAWKEST